MLLYSLEYLVLLSVLLIIYYNCETAGKRQLLFFSSLAFLAFFNISSLLFVILFNTLNYWAGKKIFSGNNKKKNYFIYISTLFVNVVSIIFINKFLSEFFIRIQKAHLQPFINDSINNQIIALGLSFYGLQNISYLIDVYKKRVSASNSYLDFSLGNSFFPKISLGPIMQHQDLNEQLQCLDKVDANRKENIIEGINRILLGLFKKLVLADRLVPITTSLYFPDVETTGLNTWAVIFIYFLQLYFDFSGYMDMAIGSARLFGIQLKENFNFPFRSVSIADFWRRWHISLMDWLTKYVYLPLSFKLRQQKRVGVFMSILVTFFVSGLWHGWGLTFLIYALIHAFYMIIEASSKKSKVNLRVTDSLNFNIYFRQILIFILVSFSLIFFRSPNLATSFNIIGNLFDFKNFFDSTVSWRTWLINGGGNIEVTFNNRLSVILSILFILYEKKFVQEAFSKVLNFKYLLLIILSILLFGVFGNVQRFIYLQF